MKPELQDKLISRFPEQFKTLSYIECGDGWYDIIYRLCSVTQNRLDYHIRTDEPLDFQWVQIKEKFGSLRAYAYNADEYIRGAIEMAEGISCITCEITGDKGKYRYKKRNPDGSIVNAWVRVLCDKEAIEEGYVDVGVDADETD